MPSAEMNVVIPAKNEINERPACDLAETLFPQAVFLHHCLPLRS